MSAIRTSTQIPAIEPIEVNMGDAIEWTRDLGTEFAASSWSVKYFLIGPARYVIDASGSGTNFSVTVTPSVSGTWLPGNYALAGFATNTDGSRRIQIYDGKLKINADPNQLPDGADIRSHAKKMLDAIEQVQETRASRPELERELQGIAQRYRYKTDEELRNEWAYWREMYDRELREDALRRGETPPKYIAARFR